jgi:hypothetical protein
MKRVGEKTWNKKTVDLLEWMTMHPAEKEDKYTSTPTAGSLCGSLCGSLWISQRVIMKWDGGMEISGCCWWFGLDVGVAKQVDEWILAGFRAHPQKYFIQNGKYNSNWDSPWRRWIQACSIAILSIAPLHFVSHVFIIVIPAPYSPSSLTCRPFSSSIRNAVDEPAAPSHFSECSSKNGVTCKLMQP